MGVEGDREWGRSPRYSAWSDSEGERYRIASSGRDGKWEQADLRQYKLHPVDWFIEYTYDQDIVYGWLSQDDGAGWVQWPYMPHL